MRTRTPAMPAKPEPVFPRGVRQRPARQRGVAIITALLLTTLSVTIVASLFWQQQVQVRSMENQRLHLQTKWILRGALDWARLVLRQDGFDNPSYTTLTAVWNTPLAETRLDQYIERERVEGEVFDATLSGRILDANARFNLTNLSSGGRQIDKDSLIIYKHLLQLVQVDPALADRTAKAVAEGTPRAQIPMGQTPPATPVASGSSTEPIAIDRVDDLLAIPGYTPEIVDKLREFVVVIPERTKVNVNTAPAEVLAALVPGMSLSEGNALVTRRTQAYFRQNSDYEGQVRNTARPIADTYAVTSEYFLVRSRIRLDRAALDAEALINRKLSQIPSQNSPNSTTTVWVRQN